MPHSLYELVEMMREHWLLLLAAGGAGAGAGFLFGWIASYFGARRGAYRATWEAERASNDLADARLEQIARAVDAIALEVERISEAQRYQAKLLTEERGAPESSPTRETGAIVSR